MARSRGRRARAPRAGYSSSVADSARRWPSASSRKRRRAACRWLVTWLTRQAELARDGGIARVGRGREIVALEDAEDDVASGVGTGGLQRVDGAGEQGAHRLVVEEPIGIGRSRVAMSRQLAARRPGNRATAASAPPPRLSARLRLAAGSGRSDRGRAAGTCGTSALRRVVPLDVLLLERGREERLHGVFGRLRRQPPVQPEVVIARLPVAGGEIAERRRAGRRRRRCGRAPAPIAASPGTAWRRQRTSPRRRQPARSCGVGARPGARGQRPERSDRARQRVRPRARAASCCRRVELHDAEGVALGVGEVGGPADAGHRHLRGHDVPPPARSCGSRRRPTARRRRWSAPGRVVGRNLDMDDTHRSPPSVLLHRGTGVLWRGMNRTLSALDVERQRRRRLARAGADQQLETARLDDALHR